MWGWSVASLWFVAWQFGVGNTADMMMTLLVALASFTLLLAAVFAVCYLMGKAKALTSKD
jgi:hypothetical protein